jgi:hypothetical protein
MPTLYFWRHTHPLTGKRVKTRHRLSEHDAQLQLKEPERIDAGALDVQPVRSHQSIPPDAGQGTEG